MVNDKAIGGDNEPGRAREGVEALEDLMREGLVFYDRGVLYDLTTQGRRFAEDALSADERKP